ncbi:uncharacterized protein PV07_06811 [Cladophialophora immunda]|uniref:Uncharacterized protein n=1 Tax=Cladophialophora immunda TaxID=569365 RepID=A0A0D2C9A8_9EURO|nr:uncharacterized protein PV07_06811 [Cladophialophora immunda]KIW27030.1 hypothetical protein PV07_06811 [Cladophialophora immunda]
MLGRGFTTSQECLGTRNGRAARGMEWSWYGMTKGFQVTQMMQRACLGTLSLFFIFFEAASPQRPLASRPPMLLSYNAHVQGDEGRDGRVEKKKLNPWLPNLSRGGGLLQEDSRLSLLADGKERTDAKISGDPCAVGFEGFCLSNILSKVAPPSLTPASRVGG